VVPDASDIRPVAAITFVALLVRIATAFVISQPGYTDSYYFSDVAERLAHGAGLTADFLWSPIESPHDPSALTLPVTSHLFWVPLPTALAALGIALLGPVLGSFRAAQLPFIVIASLLPAVTFAAARSLGAERRTTLAAALLAAFGGILAPGLVAIDAFAPAALLGTAFFLAYARASRGSVRAGALAGLLAGVLYLTRSEGALFGLPLLVLGLRPRARRAGLVGSAVALAIGAAWFARDVASGVPPDVFARSALLVRYEDFFAYSPEYVTASALPDFFAAKAGALVANLGTFVFTFGLLLIVPVAAGLRALVDHAGARAWAGLAILIYVAQSLVWTLHSTRGSYFHSLAAFFPFGLAIAAVGADRLLASRREVATGWLSGAVVLFALASGAAILQWDAVFNSGARVRAAALDAIPAGPFLAIDAAAWRWVAGRSVAVTPADGIAYAGCVAVRTNARAIVLEAAHFRRYDALYEGTERWPWLDAPIERGAIKIYPIRGEPACPAPR
jgi:hypothetical protein